MKHKIAIVGEAGFMGKSLARHLSKKFRVRILDVRAPSKDLENFVDYNHCDVRDYEQLSNGLEDVDLVIHTAIVQIPLINEYRSLGYTANVVGTQNACVAVECALACLEIAVGFICTGSFICE